MMGSLALKAENNVCGILLAGGCSSRMEGHDKALMPLDGVSLLKRAIVVMQPQIKALCLSTNNVNEHYSSFGLPIVQDKTNENVGPLGGIVAGMEWVKNTHPETDWIASFPCDTPFLPNDIVAKLLEKAKNQDVDIVFSRSGKRAHYLCSIWRMNVYKLLHRAVFEEEVREVNVLISRLKSSEVEWSAEPNDPFLNINHLEDFMMAEKQVLNDV